MIIKQSPLKLKAFFITRLIAHFSDPKSYDEFDQEAEIDKYKVDVDYHFKKPSSKSIYVLVKTDINQDSPSAGYEISSECIGMFEIVEGIPEEDLRKLIFNSALVMTLNYLRAHIANVTSPMPWGKYLLPSIDIQDLNFQRGELLKKKAEAQKAVSKAKESSTKKRK